MIAFVRASVFDARKIFSRRSFWVVAFLIVVVQPLFAFLEAGQIADIGVNATPETHPELVEALPPVAFMGFDVMAFGDAVIVVFGALLGVSEYQDRELRVTFLAVGRRPVMLVCKIATNVGVVAVLAAVGNYVTLVLTHVGLGSQGLNPFTLARETWGALGSVVLTWIVFALVSCAIAVITKRWLVALLLMVPQAVGLGDAFAASWSPARYLPVAAGHCLSALPGDECGWQPSASVALIVTTALLLSVAGMLFVRRDVGSR
ncbi:hypothetical protein [Actinomyces qiguomingii]|uniref:hypothetical protein n=1 Tax=Actinomyces qiguomingii TaxID=2057800 RepID=UPI000CA0353E|nr:hypothetical protein [Actinomyces qiguomingii]